MRKRLDGDRNSTYNRLINRVLQEAKEKNVKERKIYEKEKRTLSCCTDDAVYHGVRHELHGSVIRTTVFNKRSLNELEIAGLIMRVRQGIGEPNRIYVLIPGKEDAALA